MNNKNSNTSGELATDILAINYFSNGETLNATLWLLSPFKNQPLNYTKLNYGMLIDSDFDKKTGFDGIDYQIEIEWDNHTRSWNKLFFQWSPYGQTRILDIKHNYSGFFLKDEPYVLLSADLKMMSYPSRYKVIFYAESVNGDNNSYHL